MRGEGLCPYPPPLILGRPLVVNACLGYPTGHATLTSETGFSSELNEMGKASSYAHAVHRSRNPRCDRNAGCAAEQNVEEPAEGNHMVPISNTGRIASGALTLSGSK